MLRLSCAAQLSVAKDRFVLFLHHGQKEPLGADVASEAQKEPALRGCKKRDTPAGQRKARAALGV